MRITVSMLRQIIKEEIARSSGVKSKNQVNEIFGFGGGNKDKKRGEENKALLDKFKIEIMKSLSISGRNWEGYLDKQQEHWIFTLVNSASSLLKDIEKAITIGENNGKTLLKGPNLYAVSDSLLSNIKTQLNSYRPKLQSYEDNEPKLAELQEEISPGHTADPKFTNGTVVSCYHGAGQLMSAIEDYEAKRKAILSEYPPSEKGGKNENYNRASYYRR